MDYEDFSKAPQLEELPDVEEVGDLNDLHLLDPFLRDIYRAFGLGTVLVPMVFQRRLKPLDQGWKTTTLAQSDSPEHQAKLRRHSVGVLTGKVSGNLCAVQFTTQAAAEKFVAQNPPLAKTLITQTTAGTYVWLRTLVPPIASMKLADCAWIYNDGCCPVLFRDDAGTWLTILRSGRPAQVNFLDLQWDKKNRTFLLPDLCQLLHGPPRIQNERGKLVVNANFWAALFSQAEDIHYHPGSQAFYQRDSTGAWTRWVTEKVLLALSRFVQGYAAVPDYAFLQAHQSPQHLKRLLEALQVVGVIDNVPLPNVLEDFLENNVERSPGHSLTTEALYSEYHASCRARGLVPLPQKLFQRALRKAMTALFGIDTSHDLCGGTRRGYVNVRFRKDDEEDTLSDGADGADVNFQNR